MTYRPCKQLLWSLPYARKLIQTLLYPFKAKHWERRRHVTLFRWWYWLGNWTHNLPHTRHCTLTMVRVLNVVIIWSYSFQEYNFDSIIIIITMIIFFLINQKSNLFAFCVCACEWVCMCRCVSGGCLCEWVCVRVGEWENTCQRQCVCMCPRVIVSECVCVWVWDCVYVSKCVSI